MPVSVEEVFSQGGKLEIEFLQFCIYTQRFEVVFLRLVQDFRQHPSVAKALVLYDCFCADKAIARLPLKDLLPPIDRTLMWTVQRIRESLEAVKQFRPTEENPDPPAVMMPPLFMFERQRAALLANPDSVVWAAAREFDPELDGLDNLPGGVSTPTQRQAIREIWCEQLRPKLSAAGFWRIASLGQL